MAKSQSNDSAPAVKRAAPGPRACFLPYKVVDGEVEFLDATRKAEDLLAVVAGDADLKFHRFMIK